MVANDRVGKGYRFLVDHERSGEAFTIAELADATGYATSTLNTYLTKKWEQWISDSDGALKVGGIGNLTEAQYRRYMSQNQEESADPLRPRLPASVERLILKARQAALLALDGYNRPSTEFRSEGFIVMMVVAWTALFHAVFESLGTDYSYKDSDGKSIQVDGETKAWSLSDCAKEYWGDQNPPARRNLEFMIGLRNKIEHRYVPAIDAHVAGECQALLLNFDQLLIESFGDYFAVAESLAVPLQTSAIRSTSRSAALRVLQANEWDEVQDYVSAYRDQLPPGIYESPEFSFRVYLIPKIGNHQNSSDLAFEFVKYDPTRPEDMDALKRQVALIKDRQVQVANQGKLKASKVAALVSERLGKPFTVYSHTQAWKAYEIRKPGQQADGCKPEFCQFDVVHGDYVYTDAWVEFLVAKLSSDSEYNKVTGARK